MNILLLIFAIFIAVVGLMAARYYQQSKAENAAQRAAYSNFAAYVFGIAPIIMFAVNMFADMLAGRNPSNALKARLHFGLYAVMAIFSIALTAMLINDLSKDEERLTTFKSHYGMSVVVLVISIILFIYAAVVVAMPNKYASKFTKLTGFEASGPMAEFGASDDYNSDDFYPHLFGFGKSRGAGRRRRA